MIEKVVDTTIDDCIGRNISTDKKSIDHKDIAFNDFYQISNSLES